ncbi:amidase [Sediminivirga luteola]|uniref:amidase n=1 Tax=Sediminivirga luteola TaxID=1774748 RepID=UPI00166E13E9|nr:amidase [Sediminivirga luteola]
MAAALKRLAEVETRIRAFVDVFPGEVLQAQAQRHRPRQASAGSGPLCGVPFAVKDLYDVAGRATRSGSAASDPEPVAADATAVAALRAAGAILIGKTVTHEYAFGAMSPPARNPWDLSRVPSGSSGGSAAAVAAGVVPVALGTDTGGSIRMPAAACGVVGFKPTFGLIGRTGIFPLSSTLDHAGPITATVALAAAVVDALAGADPADPGSKSSPAPGATEGLDRGVKGIRLGIPEPFFFENADADVADAVMAAAVTLEAAGAQLVPVTFPGARNCGDAVLAIAAAEAAHVHRERFAARPGDYGEDVAEALRMGASLSAMDLVDAYRFQEALLSEAAGLFEQVDAVLTPTMGTAPPELGAESMVLAGQRVPTLTGMNAMTVHANLLGAPALAVPAGFSTRRLPISAQIIAAPGQDALALAIGHAYESLTEWHTATPPVHALSTA